jgi:hypothetical protein
MRNPGFSRLALALLLVLASAPAAAQEPPRHTVILRDVPVAEALSHVAAVTGIDLLFGGEVARAVGDQRIFCRAEDQEAERVLACVVEAAGLDYYRLSSGTYVVIAGPEEVPAYGTLVGIVTDGWSGQPLPHARVETPGSGAPVLAGRAGLFTASSLLPGRQVVVVSSPGYRPLVTEVDVLPGGRIHRSFALEAEPLRARPLVVDGVRAGVAGVGGGTGGTLVRDDLLASGEGAAGFSRALLQLPGVAPRPLLSDLLIQGGGTGEQQLRLDGVPIYNPLAVEGLLGTFSPLALERLTVHKAGFPARHGSAVSGILDFAHSDGVLGGVGREVQVDPFNANARVSLPLSGGGDLPGGLMVAGRTTLWEVAREPALRRTLRAWNQVDPLLMAAHGHAVPQVTGAPVVSEAVVYQDHGQGTDLASSDLHGAVRIPLGPGRTLGGSLYAGASEVSTLLTSAGHHEGAPAADRLVATQDAYEWSNVAGQVRYDALVGARSSVSLQLRGSRHRFGTGFRSATVAWSDALALVPDTLLATGAGGLPTLSDDARMTEVAVEGILGRALGSGHHLRLGVELARADGRVHLEEGLFPPVAAGTALGRVALSGEHRWARGPWTLEGGARATWLTDGGELFWEPRGAVELQGDAGPMGEGVVRLAGGVFRQFVNQVEVSNPGPSALVPSLRFWLPAGGGMAPPRGEHLALEASVVPGTLWEIRGEVYGKRIRDLPELDYPALLAGTVAEGSRDPGALVEPTRGRTLGLGIRLLRSGDRLRAQAGYDLTHSRRIFPSRFDGEAVPDPGDVPHRALLRLEAAPRHDLLLRARASGVWGRTWAFRRAYYDLLTVHDARPELGVGRPGDRSLPVLLEVDAGASWTLRRGGVGVEVAADLLNVLDRRNILDYGLRRRTEEGTAYDLLPRFLPGFTPALSIRAVF